MTSLNSNKAEKNDRGINYCKMPDGTLMCWGEGTIPKDSSNVTIEFPVAFIHPSYGISCTGNYANTRDISFVFANQTVTRVEIYRSTSDISYAQSFRYTAIGFWK